MILGGAFFCVGAILCAFAQDLAMLIIGRVCLGAGVGFANQVQFCLCKTYATHFASLHLLMHIYQLLACLAACHITV